MKYAFINRKEELKKLTNGLKKGKDYVLIAPRRFGKTALMKKVLENIIDDEKYIIVNIDLMSYTSGNITSVAECIIEKVLNSLGFVGKLKKIWRNMDFAFNLRMRYHDLEIESLLQMFKGDDEWALLEEALQLPEKIAIKEKKKVIVFYDEFGELKKLGTRAIELFRSVIQHHEHVHYVFAGSQESIMNSIFLDKSGAFYRFGEVLYLKELNKEDVYQYLVENFPNLGDNKMGLKDFRVIDTILEQLNGHPYYTSRAVSFFEEHPNCSYNEFYNDYLKSDLFEQERPLLEQQLMNISDRINAIDVLRIVAFGLNPYSEMPLLKEAQVYYVLTYLENSGYIRKESRGVYKLTDPLMSMLLNDN